MKKNIVVLGGNFAGLTAAIDTKLKLKKYGDDCQVTVISPSANFLYVPSLIWVPFGKRRVERISFPVEPILKKKNIKFVLDKATRILPQTNQVETEKHGTIDYDYLVVATGISIKFSVLENLEKYTNCIVTPDQAVKSYEAFQELVRNPGPVVVGATQGASCMGAAYEYLFNMERELRRHKVRNKVELTWITPEPFLGHFGIEGMLGGKPMLEVFMKMFRINYICNASIKEVKQNEIILDDGTILPYKMAMMMPPFEGAEVVKNTPELADPKGFIACKDSYQHETYKNIFAAGLAVQVIAPFSGTKVPFGVPKTGYPSDVQGKIVGENIARMISGKGQALKNKAFGKIPAICIMDAGCKEVYILSNHLFKPRFIEIMLPNVIHDFGKIFLEKYMLIKNKNGWSWMP